MSEPFLSNLIASIGFNDGANKGFWRVQPREKFGEDAGQWIEMGAELRMFYKNQRGETANVAGRAVGSTGTPDGVRVLIQGEEGNGVPDGIYAANTSNVRVADAFIPEEVLREQGIENTVKISKEQEATLPTLESLERTDITDDDIRLINEGAESPEGKQHAEYRNSEEGKAATEKESSATKPRRIVKASRKAVEDAPEGTEFFYSRGGKLHQVHVRDDGFLYKGPYVEGKEGGEDDYFGSYDDLVEANKTGRGPGPLYKGKIPTDEKFNKLNSIQLRNLLDEQESKSKSDTKPTASKPEEDIVNPEITQPYDGSSPREGRLENPLFRLPAADPADLPRKFDGSGMGPEAKRILFGTRDEDDSYYRIPDDFSDQERSTYETAWPNENFKNFPEPTRDLSNVPVEEQTDIEIARQQDENLMRRIRNEPMSSEEKERDAALNKEASRRVAARLMAEPERYDPYESIPGAIEENDPVEQAIRKLFERASFGEELQPPTVELDRLADKVRIDEASGPEPSNVVLFADELKPGMVHTEKSGREFVIVSSTKRPETAQGEDVYEVTALDSAGARRVFNFKRDFQFNIAHSPNGTPILRPTTPPAPTPPTAPPAPPTPPGKPTLRSKLFNLAKSRKLNNKPIPPTTKSDEELRAKKIRNLIDSNGRLVKVLDDNGKPRSLEDPNAQVDALLEEYPDAQVKPSGAIVLERGTFTDTDGKEYGYEVSLERTIGNQFMQRYRVFPPFADPNDPRKTLFDVYADDYKETFYSIHGKTNSVSLMRDYILGRGVPGKKGVDADGVPIDSSLRSNFGPEKTIEDRLKFLTRPYGRKSAFQKMKTANDVYTTLLTGRPEILNPDGTVARHYIPDIREALRANDAELIQSMFVNAMGRLPATKESIDTLILAFKKVINDEFKGTADYPRFVQHPNQLYKNIIRDGLDIRDRDKVPFVSSDGVTVLAPGSYVEAYNNEGEISIGRVTRLLPGTGRNGGYMDTAEVEFANGEKIQNLQTRNMRHLDDSELNDLEPDSILTPYKGKVMGDELTRRRVERGAIEVRYPSDPDGDGSNVGPGSPYLGSDGEAGDAFGGGGGIPVEDLSSGDALFSTNGEYLGTVIDIEQVPAADGGAPGFAITYLTPEGNEAVDVLDAGEVRSPK